MTTRFNLCSRWALVLAAVCFTPITGRAALTVTVEAPGVQVTTVPGVITETFDELNLSPPNQTSFAFNGDPTIGTYSSPGMAILPADLYGGAYGSHYAAIGNESGGSSFSIATLTLQNLQGYFGIYWSATDAQNELQFYNGSTLVADYHTSDVISYLQATGEYSSYLGNPNTSNPILDPTEPFAYLNFFATSANEEFNKVVMLNGPGTGFEFDNESILATTPEPTALIVWSLLGGLGITFGWWRKRKAA